MGEVANLDLSILLPNIFSQTTILVTRFKLLAQIVCSGLPRNGLGMGAFYSLLALFEAGMYALVPLQLFVFNTMILESYSGYLSTGRTMVF